MKPLAVRVVQLAVAGKLRAALRFRPAFTCGEQPAGDAWSEGFGSDVFQADEIDQMEWSVLDGMDLEELKAYKNKISKTLKEIKAQEQLWKERTNRLLDMREEAENLIDELS